MDQTTTTTAITPATATVTATGATACSNHNCEKKEKQSIRNSEEGDGHVSVVAVHSQVMKIKQEIEKQRHPSLQQPEMRRLLLRNIARHRSRSPLGSPETAILVGNS